MSTKPTANPVTTKPIHRAQRAMELAEAGKPKKPASTQVSSTGGRSHYAPEGHRRLVANVPEDMLKALKREAVERDCTVTDIIIEVLAARGYGAKSN